MVHKTLIASIVRCLSQLLEEDDLTADSRESLEVSIQCLESAYGVQAANVSSNFDILKIFKSIQSKSMQIASHEATLEDKETSEKLKNEGNLLLKSEKFHEALIKYTKAIELDAKNAVFYCNRAAVHSKLGNHYQAIKDCQTALSIDSSYSKAYGRLGLAYSSLNKFKEAKECYEKALKLEPDNESLKNNLQIAEEKLFQIQPEITDTGRASNIVPNVDLSSLLSDPFLMNMARQMLSNPAMQNMMSNIMSGHAEQEVNS
ncbi:small glutamine-rich tetratricopeptide repeat-containing protein beta isoform X2 [Copidosoma floridanum]|uniref:small glutamine-rich tetratricopeptide repeat-containing protein beta isoform X2 n=1 Tax=Copidosoma floridanum TaxID=29053 RepID=UPI0006C97B00|nr:small glutamine-rich tetratricopeptide repeat-containing protein beta isoform X2 [Copidosoma floridanum]